MSVIAWDGKIIAADRQALMGGLCYPVSKIKRDRRGVVLGWTGSTAHGLVIARWYLDGADKEKWPAFQKTDDWARLIVVSSAEAYSLEQTPEPQPVMCPPFAWGCGAEFAIGAMAMGAEAITAVLIASKYNPYCGMGVEYFYLNRDDGEDGLIP